ncbi:MAG: dienelactone hydrolase family protein [Acidimicrobiia bacterium]
MALRDYLRGEVVEDYADGFLTRREALRRLGILGLGLTSATALIAACGGDDDDDDAAASDPTTTAASTAPTTNEVVSTTTTASASPTAETITFAGPRGELQAAYAAPADPKGAVLVVHENRGLTPHFYDVAGRLAAEGYAALSVDLLSEEGGTASLADPAAAPGALADASDERLLDDLTAGIDELERRVPGAPIGVVGFCFGGGMTWNLIEAGDPRIAAAVPFYGPGPAEADFSDSNAAVLGIYAGLDDGVNASRDAMEAALTSAGLTHEIRTFEGVDHAFFNDTGPRYNEAAATEAYAALLAWFDEHLQ